MLNARIDFDIDNVSPLLDEYNSQIKNVAKRLMQSVNKVAKDELKKEAKSRGYHNSKKNKNGKNTGFGRNLISYENKDFSAKVLLKSNAYYYRFIESGANIKAKNKQFLTFKINNKWVKVKSVVIPAKPFFKEIVNEVWTKRAEKIMEERFQKELQKMEAKYK